MQLGLDHLPPNDWLGMRGMKWEQLLLHLLESARFLRHPQLMVVILGVNDLPHLSVVKLIKAIVKNFQSMEQHFPGIIIAWVDLLPMQV